MNSWKMTMSEWLETEIKSEMEIQEEFCAVTETVDIKPETLPENCEFQKPANKSEIPESITQLNDNVPLSLRCRLCARPNNDMVDLFTSIKTEESILEKIKHSLPIVVKESDGLPTQACMSCLANVELCYQFHQTVSEAEKQLLVLARLTCCKLEEIEENCGSLLPYKGQRGPSEYDNIEESLTIISDVEENNNEVTTIPKQTKTADTTVRSNVLRVSETLEIDSVVEIRTNKQATVPEEIQTVDTVVKSHDLLSSLRPCSVVLFRIESCCKNSSDVENGRESPSNTEHRNPVSTPDPIDSGSTAVSEVNQQSTRHSEKHLMNSVTHAPAHVSEQHYKCNTCAKTFKWKSELIRHSTVHMDERHHKCNTCAKTFKQKGGLTRHNRVVHMDKGIAIHKCNTCAKTFRWKSNLNLHSKIHTNKGFHSCEYCEKKFTTKANIDRHVRIHTNERPFECPTCDRSFTDPSALKQHLAIHSEERNYICPSCDQSFKSLRLRNAHMLVHASDTQRVQCDYCKNNFRAKSSLRRHLRICKERFKKVSSQST